PCVMGLVKAPVFRALLTRRFRLSRRPSHANAVFPADRAGQIGGAFSERRKGRQNVKKRDRFMHRFTSTPRKLVARMFAAAATASIAALLVSSARPKQPPAKPAPKPAPAKPAQPAQAQPAP